LIEAEKHPPKSLPYREIEGCVAGEVIAMVRLIGEAIAKGGTVIDVGGGIGTPGQSDIPAHVEGVA
jgi:hypothetical protein